MRLVQPDSQAGAGADGGSPGRGGGMVSSSSSSTGEAAISFDEYVAVHMRMSKALYTDWSEPAAR